MPISDHNSIDICSRKVKKERLTIHIRHELESRKYIFFPSILLIRGLQLPILTQMEIGGELAKEPLNRYLYYIISVICTHTHTNYNFILELAAFKSKFTLL